jgi:hypothetical protein
MVQAQEAGDIHDQAAGLKNKNMIQRNNTVFQLEHLRAHLFLLA